MCLFFCNVPDEVKNNAISFSGFQMGTLPIKYLGLLLLAGKLKKQDCIPLVARLCARVEWTCKFLGAAGRLQLVKSVLFGIHSYWSMFLSLPKCIIKKIQSILSRFLWNGKVEGPCQFKVAWNDCCLPKEEGGLGIRDLF